MKLKQINREYAGVNTDWVPMQSIDTSDLSELEPQFRDICKLISHEPMIEKVDESDQGHSFLILHGSSIEYVKAVVIRRGFVPDETG